MSAHAKPEAEKKADDAKPKADPHAAFTEAVDCVAAATKKLTDAGVGGQAAAQVAVDLWKATCGK